MTGNWRTVIRYIVSGEESRRERKDFWNSVFLPDRIPIEKKCLELLKVLFLTAISLVIGAALSLL